MKRTRKVVAMGLCLPLFLGLAACQQNNTRTEATNLTQTSSDKVPWTASYTNLNNQVSTEEVKALLTHFSILSQTIMRLLAPLA